MCGVMDMGETQGFSSKWSITTHNAATSALQVKALDSYSRDEYIMLKTS